VTLVVSDASPLIALHQVDDLKLLALVRGGFHATPDLVVRILTEAGEAEP
jgi:hypothetical protein